MKKEVLGKLSGCLLNEKVEHLLSPTSRHPVTTAFSKNLLTLVIEFNFYDSLNHCKRTELTTALLALLAMHPLDGFRRP